MGSTGDYIDMVNPADFRYTGTIKSDSVTITNGIKGDTSAATHYSNVVAKKLTPPRIAGDKEEGFQTVGVEANSWVIRAEDRTITTKMYYLVGTEKHHIIRIRNFKGSPTLLVLDTEKRDNE